MIKEGTTLNQLTSMLVTSLGDEVWSKHIKFSLKFDPHVLVDLVDDAEVCSGYSITINVDMFIWWMESQAGELDLNKANGLNIANGELWFVGVLTIWLSVLMTNHVVDFNLQ